MSYENDLVEALGLSAPSEAAPAAVQKAWTALQASLTAWRQMHGIEQQSIGSGPVVTMFEDKLSQMVSIDLRVFKNALAAAELTPDPLQGRRPIGSGFDFSTRAVSF